MDVVKTSRILLILSMLLTVGFAAEADEEDGIGSLKTALQTLCKDIKGLIPIVSFLLIVIAGVIYAAGQVLGAETRARASVWATAMIVGALIGLIIVVVTPTVLEKMYTEGTGKFKC